MDTHCTNHDDITVVPTDGRFVVCRGRSPISFKTIAGDTMIASFDNAEIAVAYARFYELIESEDSSSSD
jgi:hypothetical protein